jgi:hypothetical protein
LRDEDSLEAKWRALLLMNAIVEGGEGLERRDGARAELLREGVMATLRCICAIVEEYAGRNDDFEVGES